MNRIKVAVIGVGFWGKNHVRVFNELPETELVAVCDVNKQRADTIAEQYDIEAYGDSHKLLHQSDIDAVSICTWTTTHAKEAIRVIEAGKQALVEKPLANTTDEAKRIVDLARRSGTHLMVGFIERFNPAVRRIKNTLQTGGIGDLVSATVKRVSQWPERIGDVGVVKDYAIHDIDIMRDIFGEDPRMVYAITGSLKHKRFEDYAQIMMTFDKAKTAFIEANWLTPYKVRRLTLTGSKAITSLDYLTQEIVLETSDKTIKPRYRWTEPLKVELQHFAQSVLHGKEPEVTGLDGYKALAIAEAALKSSQTGEAIKLKFS